MEIDRNKTAIGRWKISRKIYHTDSKIDLNLIVCELFSSEKKA